MYLPRYQSLNGNDTGLLKHFILIFIHRFLRVCIEYKNSIYRVCHVKQNVKISLLISKIGKSVGEESYIVQGDTYDDTVDAFFKVFWKLPMTLPKILKKASINSLVPSYLSPRATITFLFDTLPCLRH